MAHLKIRIYKDVFTIKDLQDVELLLGLEELKVQRDVVALLHTDHPRAHLLVGVVFWEAWTQDHARGVEQHLVVRASHWKERKSQTLRSKGTIVRRIGIAHWFPWSGFTSPINPPYCCNLLGHMWAELKIVIKQSNRRPDSF